MTQKFITDFAAHKSSSHKVSKKHKISQDKNLDTTKHTQTSNTIFEELVPLALPLLKTTTTNRRLGHAGIVDHFVHLSIPD